MFYSCLNNISKKGLIQFKANYKQTEDLKTTNLILVRSFNMHEMDISNNLLAIARAGAGVNNIPLNKMAEKGVVVFNTPGANANGVKELVIAGMLLASRDIFGGINWVKLHKNDEDIQKNIEKAKKAFAGTELIGRSITVIGLGAVGSLVANACSCLGMKVYGFDPYISEKYLNMLNSSIEIEQDLNKLYAKSDFISLHLPLLDSTRNMLNDHELSKFKAGTILLNFSRDSLVENLAIKKALENGRVSKYVTDFPNYFTANLENVISIPHLGASTIESEENCAIMAAKQLMSFVENGDIINSVNYPNISLGKINGKTRIIILAKINDELTYNIDLVFKSIEKSIQTSVSKVRNDFAVYVYDFRNHVEPEIINQIEQIIGVTKVRKLTK